MTGNHGSDDLVAEDLYVDERLITAPAAGLFHPLVFYLAPDCPRRIAAGDQIGHVDQSGTKVPVPSGFAGVLIGMLVLPGERVRIHQPVAWLRTDQPDGLRPPDQRA